MLAIGTKIHFTVAEFYLLFTYLTQGILDGEIIGRRYSVAEVYDGLNPIVPFIEVESYCIGIRDNKGEIVDWRWINPTVVKAIDGIS